MMETLVGGIVAFFASGGGAWVAIRMRMDAMEKRIKEAERANLETRSHLNALHEKVEWIRAKLHGVTRQDDGSLHIHGAEDKAKTPPHSGAQT